VLPRDLSEAVEWPQVYRLSTVPRSITWAEVGTVLAAVDRRTRADGATTRSCCSW
jgi:integrase/recombinase XerD